MTTATATAWKITATVNLARGTSMNDATMALLSVVHDAPTGIEPVPFPVISVRPAEEDHHATIVAVYAPPVTVEAIEHVEGRLAWHRGVTGVTKRAYREAQPWPRG